MRIKGLVGANCYAHFGILRLKIESGWSGRLRLIIATFYAMTYSGCSSSPSESSIVSIFEGSTA